jgi:hypothetical protein
MEEREPKLGVAVGRKGCGKTYQTTKMIESYILGNPAKGVIPRRALILDVNDEYETIKALKVNGSFNVSDDELATQITKFLFNSWPKIGDVYEKQKNTDEVKSVKESIKQSIIMAKSLGL